MVCWVFSLELPKYTQLTFFFMKTEDNFSKIYLDAVEGTCNKQRFWSDCANTQADLSLVAQVLLQFLSCAG